MSRNVAGAVAVLQILLSASPVRLAAHAILLASEPRPGATVAAGPLDFLLRYNSRIDATRSRLTLTAPDGARRALNIAAAAPDELRAQTTLTPGKWSLRWQVLATDGHVTRGDVTLTVAP